ncbi:MAG: tRNA preQ1(34) S-adenosylmethionine ribosyltransferase-isomerase QueA [Armatimonadota bacterium]|nr:tRNA preQ1(34) S-adenosylmethionine ribosyltransferase-isomerase QueA [Armatimonadota bacterium]
MRLEDFDYRLPTELIAQRPAAPRDSSRLLVVHRADGRLEHRIFREIGAYLTPGDVLVVNDTRVIPARLHGRRPETGGAVELLLLRPVSGGGWEALVRPGRRLKPGAVVHVGPGVPVEIADRLPGGRRLIRRADGGDLRGLMAIAGEMPTPPYIHRPLDDPAQYQTMFARTDGAVAAPTAGLHFTSQLIEALRAQGIVIVALTLHVGPGTFQPVVVEEIARHQVEPEHYAIGEDAAAAINARRGRLVAVGTTTVRALEGAAADGIVKSGVGWTDLFITPGYRFRVVEALVTNFHLPKTTLLMLVCAFAGRELIMSAYREAVRERYRFYSFGDAMLIV